MAEEGAVVAPPPPACRAAVVSGLFVGPWIELLAVRTGPGVEHPILDRLGNGYPLQVCAREGEWFAIVEADCPVNVMSWEGSPCAKGWSYRKWIIPASPPSRSGSCCRPARVTLVPVTSVDAGPGRPSGHANTRSNLTAIAAGPHEPRPVVRTNPLSVGRDFD